MTWTVILATLAICVVKVLMTCLPTGVVNWLLNKFALHPKLHPEQATVTINGKAVEEKEQAAIIAAFNKATVLEKYTIYSGYNEHVYLHPENAGTPIVIEAKIEKKMTTFIMHRYSDHIDIVKQYKKKLVAYSVHVEPLQQHFMPQTANLA